LAAAYPDEYKFRISPVQGAIIMKIKLSFYLTLGVCVLCISSLTGNSYAAGWHPSLDNAGTICKNYNAAEVTDIDYMPNGVRNLNASPRYVICPIVRNDPGTNGGRVTVSVDGFAPYPSTVSCTIFTASGPDGHTISSQFSGPMTDIFDPFLSIRADEWDTVNVLCLLPGNSGAEIFDLDIVPGF